MPDYQALYITLFNKVTDLIEELQDIQRQMEEMYISSGLTGEASYSGNIRQ